MKRISMLLLVSLAGCGGDWRTAATSHAENIVRQQSNETSVKFIGVKVTGDSATGQVCGHYQSPDPGAGTDDFRFIFFVDGGGGQNPYTDDPSTPFPANKSDFELNWHTQCLDLGYAESRAVH